MDDRILHELRAAPPAEFAKGLRTRLQRQDRFEVLVEPRHKMTRLAALAAGAVVVVALFAIPLVRASAQAFLNLFRVVNFTAVPVNVERLNQLSQKGLDIGTLIGQQSEVLVEPGPARVFQSPVDAAKAAGIELKLPALLPPGVTMLRAEVDGERAARLTGDTRKLREVLDALGLNDVPPPAGLDGQVATVRVSPIVRIVYASGNRDMTFQQA